jgi:hypothetical protein
MESWQIFHVAHKKLPPGTLQSIYRRSARLVTYWAANPKYCEETKRNPIDRIRDMLEALDIAGFGEYSRAAIDYMAEPLDGCYADRRSACSDKGSIEGEVMDVTIALDKLSDEIRFALEDGELSTAEKIKIKNYAHQIKRGIYELLDAAGIK